MSSIQQILASILNAVYGKDVRQAIHDGVEMAYNKADDAATSAAAAAEAASGSQESAAASAQAASNSASSASDFADAAEQYKNEAFHTTPAGYEAFVGEVNSSLDYLVHEGVKNIFKVTKKSGSNGNINYEINENGEVTLNGEKSSSGLIELGSIIFDNDIDINLSGCPTGGTTTSFRLTLYDTVSGTDVLYEYGSGATYTLLANRQYNLYIWFYKNYQFTNVVFKPMITHGHVVNSDYAHFVPYAEGNGLLTTDVKALKNLLLEKTDTYASDLNNIDYTSCMSCNSNSSNKPTGVDWAVCLTFYKDSNSAVQFLLGFTGTKKNVFFTRVKQGGTWTSWNEYATA